MVATVAAVEVRLRCKVLWREARNFDAVEGRKSRIYRGREMRGCEEDEENVGEEKVIFRGGAQGHFRKERGRVDCKSG